MFLSLSECLLGILVYNKHFSYINSCIAWKFGDANLSDDSYAKSWIAKRQYTSAGDKQMKILKHVQYFVLNTIFLLTIDVNEYIILRHFHFDIRKKFIWSKIIVKTHFTRCGTWNSTRIFLIEKYHWFFASLVLLYF